METGLRSHHGELFVHPLSNPGAAGICPEMLEVAEEANRAGDFNLAVEIYSSQLADLQHPDRGLCLRKADSLARAGRISEALDSYCTAANLGKLHPDELPFLVESIARTLREKEPPAAGAIRGGVKSSGGEDGANSNGECDDDDALDLFSCRLCKCLLHEPTTVECGHTFCKRCLEDDAVKDCAHCKQALSKKDGLAGGRRLNVVLSGLLDKLFATESKARRCWIEGEVLWKKQSLGDALDKYNAAVDLVPSSGRLLCQRAELHMEMRNFSQAVQDASTLCRIKPHWTKAHFLKATALSKADRNDEALQEYFTCVALKPDWTKVKLEAQKVLSELFSSVFEKEDMPTPLHPLQGGLATRLIKPPALLQSLSPLTQSPGSSTQDSEFSVIKNAPVDESSFRLSGVAPCKSDSGAREGSAKSLADVLAALPAPPGGLKRKHSIDGPSTFNPPSKVLRPDDASTFQTASVWGGRMFPAELLDSGDMECSLCMRLFYEPVATPCGHTFCLKCLERCLDHNPNCPLCKENLSEYLATRGYNKTLLMEEVLRRYLGDELTERKKIHEEEMKELSNLNQEVPIFVCTMAFPTIPCPLHVFEPRYRLMIRRSMETGTKQFGMCIADELKGFADYGCMLQVRDVKFFPDGRSVVDTIGVSRFKVLSHGQRDGYNTAKIDYLEDKKVEGEELVELLKLHDSVYEQANSWFTSLKDNMKSQILSHFGHLPSKDPDPQGSPSGPAWCWWLLAVLPLENRAQLTILAMTSLKDRLIAIRRVLIFVTRKRPR
ncbi:LON peptidase N-terminal domain and RING finger protein 2 [Betta splendens]|uniref:LON peptidase N-terminal domain and RING finger protein 2 n=1 Tax=Betta splendens TaxID=158456 RepID=A0A6P7LG81_BETSP|nr:LON peptidase N-terminal domain and RING finger protein 2 [Betta splendens]XP_028992644.1 LON peptidase N-terminal domain and RING finger protein 2 [Betta splendens]XP_055361023.1 LON peptidase N-terminal domain and RING finger protein 2 [Betta splendens]